MRLLPLVYSVRNLGRSPLRLAATVGGSALVVVLVVAAAGFVRGMERALTVGRGTENVILLSAGSEESIERSQIEGQVASLVAAQLPGIRTVLGVPFVSPEVHVALMAFADGALDRPLHAIVRGITPAAFLVHPRVEMVEGRMPRPGNFELLAGGLASVKMGLPPEDLAVGKVLRLGEHRWTIVGRFRARGAVMDTELWAPLSDVQLLTRRSTVSCVVLALDDAEFADVDVFTRQRLDLELAAIREADYYTALLRFYQPVRMMVWATALLLALAGLLGGLNTIYAAFAARVREIGMLQALGFSRTAVVIGLLQESLIAAAAGSLVGAGAGLVLLNGLTVRFSMGVFELAVDPSVLLSGLTAGLLLGLVGALPPAWRCVRLPIPTALKATG